MGFFGRNARPSSEKAQNEGNAEPEQNETEQIETEQTERVGAADVPKEHVTSSSWTLWQSPHGNASAPKGAWRNHRPERPPTISIRDMPTLPEVSAPAPDAFSEGPLGLWLGCLPARTSA